jgi:hypothetical protein
MSPEAFKTFIYLISQADDAGKMAVCWQMIATRVFPFGEVGADAVEAMVKEMYSSGLVNLYVVDGKEIIKHPNWTRFQKIDRPTESLLPDPRALDERSTRTRRGLDERSRKTRANVIEDKGTEAKLNEPASRTRRGVAEKPAAVAAIAEAPDLPLYHSVEQAFLSRNDDRFTDYPKEGAAIKGLIKKAKARAPGSEEAFIADMLGAFWKLRTGDDKFWQGQPFLPSALNSSSIWDRVLETMRSREKMEDPEAMAIAKGDIF